MTTHKAIKRPRDEDSEPLEFDSSDSDAIIGFSEDDNPQTKGKKRSKLESSNSDIIRSTVLKKLRTAPRGSIGIPAVRALLAKSGSSSLSKLTAASRETNSGLRSKAVSGSASRKSSNTKRKGKERAARRPSPPVKEKRSKVAVIIFLHKGVVSFDEMNASEDFEMDPEDEDELRPEYVLVKPPAQLSPDFIQRHKHYGLAVASGTTGIDIAYEANFWDIEEMLRSFFPTLFEWFDTLPKVEGNSNTDFGDSADLPQWLLCTKLPGRSSGVSIAAGVAFPNGSDIDFNVQTKRSGFRENILILTTRTPIPTELLNKWQKCVGKKGAKSTPYMSPSPIDDSDSEFPLLGTPTPLIRYATRSSLAALPGGDANAVAGPSTVRHSQSNGTQEATSNGHGAEVIEIEDSDSLPSSTQRRTASPTTGIGMIENLNTSFSGSFYVDESLKALNPWDASAVNEAWEF